RNGPSLWKTVKARPIRQPTGRPGQGRAEGPQLCTNLCPKENSMRKLLPVLFTEGVLLLILMSVFSLATRRTVSAQTSYPDPANEQSCRSQTGAGGGDKAIPVFVTG